MEQKVGLRDGTVLGRSNGVQHERCHKLRPLTISDNWVGHVPVGKGEIVTVENYLLLELDKVFLPVKGRSRLKRHASTTVAKPGDRHEETC